MIRFLGGLTGGALAIGAIVLLVGVPAIVKPVVTESGSREPVTEVPAPPSPDPEAVPAIAETSVAAPASPRPDEPVQAAAPEPEPVIPVPAPSPAAADTTEPLRWHAFWSPFRSQIAANGFVSQLQTVTGLDYRVVSVKPGVYEVAFAYHDETEITENLTQISAATGLDVPGS